MNKQRINPLLQTSRLVSCRLLRPDHRRFPGARTGGKNLDALHALGTCLADADLRLSAERQVASESWTGVGLTGVHLATMLSDMDHERTPEIRAEEQPIGPVAPCPQCGFPMMAVRGSKEAVCGNCGFKDSCCY